MLAVFADWPAATAKKKKWGRGNTIDYTTWCVFFIDKNKTQALSLASKLKVSVKCYIYSGLF